MDLKQFVSETLTQIVAGIEDARHRIPGISSGAKINPDWFYRDQESSHGKPSPVDFDVALVVTSEATSALRDKVGGSAGLLSVVSAKLSSEMESKETGSERNESISRVKFSVLLSQPADIDIVDRR